MHFSNLPSETVIVFLRIGPRSSERTHPRRNVRDDGGDREGVVQRVTDWQRQHVQPSFLIVLPRTRSAAGHGIASVLPELIFAPTLSSSATADNLGLDLKSQALNQSQRVPFAQWQTTEVI